jgi:hypothetical protein
VEGFWNRSSIAREPDDTSYVRPTEADTIDFVRRALWFALSLSIVGCFTDSSVETSSDSGDETPCTPGEQQACDCPGRPGAGVQVCRETGVGFEACMCEVDTATSTASTDSTTSDSEMTSVGVTATSIDPDTTSMTGIDPSGSTGSMVLPIQMYASFVSISGDIAGQAGGVPIQVADDECAASAEDPRVNGCENYAAVLCSDTDRTVIGMQVDLGIPDDRAIVGPNGKTIANSWSGLLDDPLQASLTTAGIGPEAPWTGALSGGMCGNNCSDWSSGTDTGTVASLNDQNANWIGENASAADCNTNRTLLCVCW